MKLISMTDYVLEQYKSPYKSTELCVRFLNYAEFLRQPLTLGMFIPCDLKGNFLEEPKAYNNYLSYNKGVLKENHPDVYKKCEQYQQAEERVLFEGFKLESHITKSKNDVYSVKNGIETITFHAGLYNFNGHGGFATTLEDLIVCNLTVIETAIKQLTK